MRWIILIIKKSEYLSALAIRLVYWTGKSKVPIHPKHLIRKDSDLWYKSLLTKKTIILDAGCGSGQHCLQIAKYVKKVIGIDKNEESLKIAKIDAKNKRIKNAEFMIGDFEKSINLDRLSIDVVILFDVLEHIKKRQKFLREIKRIMKKNAKVLVAIPNKDTSWKKLQRKYGIVSYSDPDHKIEYSKDAIAEELNRAGFRIEKITSISYDTPWIGFIDLVGGISLSLYKKLGQWRKNMSLKYPDECVGFQIIAAIA